VRTIATLLFYLAVFIVVLAAVIGIQSWGSDTPKAYVPHWVRFGLMIWFLLCACATQLSGSDIRLRLFSAMLAIAAGAYGIGILSGAAQTGLGWVENFGLEAFLPLLAWQFFSLLASSEDEPTWDHASFGLFALGVVLFAANVFGTHDAVRANERGIYWFVVYTGLLVSFFNGLLFNRKNTSPEAARFRWFTLAVTPVVVAGLLIVVSKLPGMGIWFQLSWVRSIVVPISTLLFALIPTLTSIVLLLEDPFRFDLSLRLKERYLANVVLVQFVTLSPLIVGLWVLMGSQETALGEFLSSASGLVVGLCVVLTFVGAKYQSAATEYLQNALSRSKVNTDQVIAEMLNALDPQPKTNDELLKVFSLISAVLARHLNLSRVYFFVQSDDATLQSLNPGVRSIPSQSVVLNRLRNSPKNLLYSKQVAMDLPEFERIWLADYDVDLLLEAAAAPNKVVVLLGARLGGDRMARREIDLVRAIALILIRYLVLGVADENPDMGRHLDKYCATCWRVNAVDECNKNEHLLYALPIPNHFLGKYIFDRVVGQGGAGLVLLAKDQVLNRPVALKILPKQNPEQVKRLHSEAKVIAGVCHPNLAEIHSFESWQGNPVVVMEYFGGGTLDQMLEQGPLSGEFVLSVAKQLISAIAHIHSSGYVHGDIKPANIGVVNSRWVKLLDFGTARLLKQNALPLGGGSPAYMSAGAIKAQPLDLRTDMWALGVTLLEALCGYNLFQRATLNETYAAVLATTELDVYTLNPEISVDLKRIISRRLSKSPALGFTSTQEIETEIANIGT
jgi:hypothetical protein